MKYPNLPAQKYLSDYMYIIRYMRSISISDSTYDDLKKLKKPDMSFSDAIDILLEKQKTGTDRFFGVLAGSPVLDEIQKLTEENRHNTKFRI